MDEELQRLEMELKRLAPRTLTAHARSRIAASIREESERKPAGLGWWSWMFGMGLAAALVVIGLVAFQHSPSRRSSEPAKMAALESQNSSSTVEVSEIYWDPEDVGILIVDDQPAAQVVNYQKLTSFHWQNDKEGWTVEWVIPAMESAFIPLEGRL